MKEYLRARENDASKKEIEKSLEEFPLSEKEMSVSQSKLEESFEDEEKEFLLSEEEEKIFKMVRYDSNWSPIAEISSPESQRRLLHKLCKDDAGLVAILPAAFSHIERSEVASCLIKNGLGIDIWYNHKNFPDVDFNKLGINLIERGKVKYMFNVGFDYGLFQRVDSEFITKLIENGGLEVVVRGIPYLSHLDKKIALELIYKRGVEKVLSNIRCFDGFDNEMALMLIDMGGAREVGESLSRFQDLDSRVALKLIQGGGARYVVKYVDEIKGFDLDNETALKIIEFEQPYDVFENLNKFHGLDYKKLIRVLLNKKRIDVVIKFLDNFKNLDEETAILLIKNSAYDVVDTNIKDFILSSETIEGLKKYPKLKFSEYLISKGSLLNTEGENSYANSFSALKKDHPNWKDQENIIQPFEEGAALFGYEKMFVYLDRQGLSRHDGLHNFRQIIELAHTSNLSPAEFYNNILNQVTRDDATYDDGTAHHHLNNIATNLSLDFEKTRATAEKYPDVEKLQELTDILKTPADIFASWKNLKKYEELSRLLEQADILEELQELKKSGHEKLYRYVETLAFHPNIEMEKVLQFWRDPEGFLELGDTHTPEKVHNRKKPSNYVNFPHLDLSAEELRDALIDGTYDTLQVFQPLSIEYKIPKEGVAIAPLKEELSRALGKRKEGIKGEAKNPPKLFKEIQEIFTVANISLSEFLAGNITLSEDMMSHVREKLYEENTGLSLKEKDIEEYRAKINLKSDPDAVVAGNDTACCMPFGSGKNNVYTFNPDCALFTLQKKNANGVWRTIAQSVLTKDVMIEKNVETVISAMQEEGRHLNEIVTDDILREKKSIIACDNIEVSPNFKSDDMVIATLYRDFFSEYVKHHGEADGFVADHVVIGKGYTDALTSLPSIENKFIPRAPVGYSDKLGNSVYTLSIKKSDSGDWLRETPIVSREVINPLVTHNEEKKKSKTDLPHGVSPLTFEQSLPVAYIEGKAYRDNEGLIQYLHNMENALIAKDVNNAAKRRPNMSFKYEDEKGMMHGYLLAYEGSAEIEEYDGKVPVLYVSDLASDGNQRAGGSLILGFTGAYKQNYLDKGNLIPIYAQMREKTSYAIIKKQLEKLSVGTGISFEIEERETYEVEKDTMHQVMIRAIKK